MLNYQFLVFVRFCFRMLSLFRMGGGGQAKRPPTSVLFVTSIKVGISPQNVLSFILNPFLRFGENFKTILIASPKLLNMNQDHLPKNWFSWSNPCKIEVMITSLIEMLELPNFGHMTTSTI